MFTYLTVEKDNCLYIDTWGSMDSCKNIVSWVSSAIKNFVALELSLLSKMVEACTSR